MIATDQELKITRERVSYLVDLLARLRISSRPEELALHSTGNGKSGPTENANRPGVVTPGRAKYVRLRSCDQTLNSGRRFASWAWRRCTILECIWLTRDSERLSVAPISFIVISS